MQKRTFLWQAHCAVFLAAFGFAALTMAQNPPAAPSSTNDDWLAQARKMYYSSTVSGLKGFDCEMRPNWEALFLTQNGGQMSATNQAKVTLLGSVKVALHARMDGSSVLDWNSPPQQTKHPTAAGAPSGRSFQVAAEEKSTPETLTTACHAASWLARSWRCGWRCASIGPENFP